MLRKEASFSPSRVNPVIPVIPEGEDPRCGAFRHLLTEMSGMSRTLGPGGLNINFITASLEAGIKVGHCPSITQQ